MIDGKQVHDEWMEVHGENAAEMRQALQRGSRVNHEVRLNVPCTADQSVALQSVWMRVKYGCAMFAKRGTRSVSEFPAERSSAGHASAKACVTHRLGARQVAGGRRRDAPAIGVRLDVGKRH